MLPPRLRAFFTHPGRSQAAPARIFWVALAVRLLYITLAHTYRVRPFDDHFQFGWEAGRIARALVTGYGYADPFNGHSGPSAWTPPLYPLLLAAIFKLCGVYSALSAWVILAVDSVFSAATALAVYEIAHRSFSRLPNVKSLALWSGWLWALYPAALQYAVKWIWDTTLSAFLFTFVLVLALRIRGTGAEPQSTASNWAIFGLLWGTIALTNSSLLIFLPACGLWMIWQHHSPRNLARAALSALVFLALLAPWTIRNQRAFHAFVPLRSNFGAEFYQSVLPVNGAFPWGTTISLNPQSAQFQRFRSMGELAYSKAEGARATAFLHANPSQFAAFTLKRIDFFWCGVAQPADKHPVLELLRQLNFSLLSVSGLLGLALALKRRVPVATLYAWAFALVPLLYYAITVQARFRHPLEPLMTVLTVYLFQAAEVRTRTRREMTD